MYSNPLCVEMDLHLTLTDFGAGEVSTTLGQKELIVWAPLLYIFISNPTNHVIQQELSITS